MFWNVSLRGSVGEIIRGVINVVRGCVVLSVEIKKFLKYSVIIVVIFGFIFGFISGIILKNVKVCCFWSDWVMMMFC